MKNKIFLIVCWVAAALNLSGCAGSVGYANGDFCWTCDVVVAEITPNGGVVYGMSNNSINVIQNLASANCQQRGLGVAIIGSPTDPLHNGKYHYAYTCQQQSISDSRTNPIPPSNYQTQPIQETTSIDDAKDKCKDLGFKPGTEGFGNCVLKLSK